MKYLVEDEENEETYRFNMHELFPERFNRFDPTGEETWDYDWAADNTGSKWFPKLSVIDQGDATDLIYNTAREPNNLTLERLHKLTGWTIKNAYEEPGMAVAGDFICHGGECRNEEREFTLPCDCCDVRYTWENLHTNDENELICDQCHYQEKKRN